MRDTTSIGNRSLAFAVAALLNRRFEVLLPFGEGLLYDLVIRGNTTNHEYKSVQCKTGILRRGAIYFRNYTVKKGKNIPYGNAIDYYVVYCPQTKTSYLIGSDLCSVKGTSLRIDTPKNGAAKNIRWAKDYEL